MSPSELSSYVASQALLSKPAADTEVNAAV